MEKLEEEPMMTMAFYRSFLPRCVKTTFAVPSSPLILYAPSCKEKFFAAHPLDKREGNDDVHNSVLLLLISARAIS
jgi:hypothetical protein